MDGSSISDLFGICELHGTQEGFARVLFGGCKNCPPRDLLEGEGFEAAVECDAAINICGT